MNRFLAEKLGKIILKEKVADEEDIREINNIIKNLDEGFLEAISVYHSSMPGSFFDGASNTIFKRKIEKDDDYKKITSELLKSVELDNLKGKEIRMDGKPVDEIKFITEIRKFRRSISIGLGLRKNEALGGKSFIVYIWGKLNTPLFLFKFQLK